MTCKKCGEHMEGDGSSEVLHCVNAPEEKYQYHEPDANPVYCDFEEEKSQ